MHPSSHLQPVGPYQGYRLGAIAFPNKRSSICAHKHARHAIALHPAQQSILSRNNTFVNSKSSNVTPLSPAFTEEAQTFRLRYARNDEGRWQSPPSPTFFLTISPNCNSNLPILASGTSISVHSAPTDSQPRGLRSR
ncbi:hypothetical protein ACEPAH_1848 [Sanghuangporus vaninii]